tara:strand:- start:389 stop:1249 length:861 start_codon:yes stop_codon:yes gene_type:complete
LAFGGGGSSTPETLAHTHSAVLSGDGGDLSETLTDMNGVPLYSLITDNSAAVAANTVNIATNAVDIGVNAADITELQTADIQLDSQVSTSDAVNGTTLTADLTVAANSDKILIVSANALGVFETISSVTFGAQSLTQEVTEIYGTNGRADLWYLVNPTAGTSTITVTWTASVGRRTMGGYSFYNVDQASPIGVTATDTGTNSPAGGNITPTTANSLIIDSIMWTAGSETELTLTPGYAIFIGGTDRNGGSQFKNPSATSANNAMVYNQLVGSTGSWSWVAMEIKRA